MTEDEIISKLELINKCIEELRVLYHKISEAGQPQGFYYDGEIKHTIRFITPTEIHYAITELTRLQYTYTCKLNNK